MIAALATGWLAAGILAAVVLRLRRRLELVAGAEHELRGPAAALGLALDAAQRTPWSTAAAGPLDAELERLRAGIEDLAAARRGGAVASGTQAVRLDRLARSSTRCWRSFAAARGRRLLVDWQAGPVIVHGNRGRLARVLGNLLSNAVEHGAGDVRLVGRRSPAGVVLEVLNDLPAGPRGRGLALADRAVREAGGRLTLERRAEHVTAAVELPVAEP